MSTPKTASSPAKPRDPDFVYAEIAMQRAAEKAAQRARQLGTEPVTCDTLQQQKADITSDDAL